MIRPLGKARPPGAFCSSPARGRGHERQQRTWATDGRQGNHISVAIPCPKDHAAHR